MPGTNEHESFHLLQISDSLSDSLPDLDLVTVNPQQKKKKVRLKRRERNTARQHTNTISSKVSDDDHSWQGILGLGPGLCWLNMNCVMVVVSVSCVMVVLVMSYITTTLHTRVVDLEHQLRIKISDDESKAIPEKIQFLENKIDILVRNQSGILENSDKVQKILSFLQNKVEDVQKGSSSNAVQINRIKEDIDLLTKISSTNEKSIKEITDILATLNITTPAISDTKSNKNSTSEDSSQEWKPLNNGRP